jgi:hypothetical protein
LPLRPPLPPAATPAERGAPQAAWRAELWLRFRHRLVLKTLGITAFMTLFFAAYFHLLRHPVRPPLVMPLTALDRAIAFEPRALAAYFSLWIYVGIPPGLMLRVREAVVYGVWAGALCLAGLACFYFVPTAVPPFEFGAEAAQHAGFALIQGIDAAGNACPSLHVATAAFTAVWIHRLLRVAAAPGWLHGLNLAWLLAIVYSTLAIRQHVAIDVGAGLLLAAVFALPSLRWAPATLRAGAELGPRHPDR